MSEPSSRAERRRRKHEMRKLQKFEAKKSARKSSALTLILGLIILIGVPALWWSSRTPAGPNNEVEVEIMSREHIGSTDGIVYNSNPPTSGPHFSNWEQDWDFYDTDLPMGGLIHNMEHGGVVVLYRSSVDDATKEQLKQFTKDNFKTIAAMNDDIPSPIAMASWGVYEWFETFDEAAMKRFYKRNLNHAPENVYP